jgi:U3 small nucleolar RNA-associated protein 12
MPLTRQYLRYEHAATLGAVIGRKPNLLITQASPGKAQERRRVLVVAPAAEDVIVWDPRRGDAAAVLRGTGKQEVGCVCMSRDGRLVAAGCEEGTLRVWDMSSYQVVVSFSGHRSAVTCIQFDCSGTRLVSGSKDTNVIVWDVVGECGLYRLRGHKGPVTGCRLLQYANILVTCSKDSLVKLWDLDTQHCFQTIVGHKSEVWGIELVAKETRLVTVSSDMELLVFQLSWRQSDEEEKGERERGGKRKTESVGDTDREGKVGESVCLCNQW